MRVILAHSSLWTLESWQDSLRMQEVLRALQEERQWSTTTYNIHRKNIICYVNSLVKMNVIHENVTRAIEKQKEIITDQPVASEKDIKHFFRFLEHLPARTHLEKLRNILYFRIASVTGARPIELLHIAARSFRFGYSQLTLIGAKQNKKSRHYTLPIPIQDRVRAYVNEAHLCGRSSELQEYFFLSRVRGRRWTVNGVNKVVQRIAKKRKTPMTTYMLRRFVATELYKQ